jgi:hypothetical protein
VKDIIDNNLLAFIGATNPNYVTSLVHRYLCSKIQNAVLEGNARLAISIPPRHGKSEIISKALPAWFFGRKPDAQVMQICYGSDLASDFGVDVRSLMSSPLYKYLYPLAVPTGDGKSGSKWRTVSDGRYKGVGVGGAITGFGADLMVIDDIVKNRQEAHSPAFKKVVREFFGSTLFSRVLPGGSVIILMTRWTSDDLVGIVTEELGWEYINLPALCTDPSSDPLKRNLGDALFPEFYPQSRLLEIKRSCTEYDWQALYQGQPPDSVSNVTFTHTPPDYPPSSGLWYNGTLGLFHQHCCTHLVDCDTLNDLLLRLKELPYINTLYTNHPIATTPGLKSLLPYQLTLVPTKPIPDYYPSITTSVPVGVTPSSQQLDCIRQWQVTQLGQQHPSSNRLGQAKIIYK